MRTRFAPSPTGPLHLGHAFSALTAFDLANSYGGTFLLRIEDIDQGRARSHWETQIFDDLKWLGLAWPTPVLRQSANILRYSQILDQLWADDLLYPCHCNRRDIQNALSAPQEGAAIGPDGIIYPGTCRRKEKPSIRPDGVNLRLDMAKALKSISDLSFIEHMYGSGPREIRINHFRMTQEIGDIVVSRKDMATSYHLSVVIDDAYQGISDVVRGEDLFNATPIHVLLQTLTNLPTPDYHHHTLVRDESGKRLAKRDDARALSIYRSDGLRPKDIRQMVGLS